VPVDLVGRAAVLDQQHTLRLAVHEPGGVAVRRVGPSPREGDAVEQLDVGRRGLEDWWGRGRRCGQSVELERRDASPGGQRMEAQIGAGDDCEGALGATHQLREIEHLGIHEGVEAVARHPPHHAGIAPADLVAVALPQLQGGAQEGGLGVLAPRAPLRLGPRQGS
jgi:hypothetical protein